MTSATGPEQLEPERDGSGGSGSRLLMVAVLAVFVAIAVGVGFLIPAASPPSGTAGVAPAAPPPPGPPPAPAGAPRAPDGSAPLVVSLTFDDGLAGQMQYLQTLKQNGLTGTFYVNTGDIGQPNYMTRADLTQIAAAGDEIGGHSVSHPNLAQDAPDETARQICDDRTTLTSWGFDPVSFAYPFGAYSPSVKAAVRDCGYTNARRVGGLGVAGTACPDCVGGELLPPSDPFEIRTPPEISTSTTLADLENAVVTARTGGGAWVPFIFHHESCANCGELSTTPALLSQFAAWLADQQRAGTLVVRTVGQTIGRAGGAAHTAPAATSPAVPNGDLAQGSGTVPDCWESTGYGRNTADFRWAPPGPGVPASETVTVSSYTDGDATMLPRLDLGQCTPSISPGTRTHLAAQYRSTVPTQFIVYRRTGTGSWEYWTASPYLGPAAAWSPITWDTPPAPPDTTGVAAGLTVNAVGWVQSSGYTEQAIAPPPLIPPGLRGLLEVGAVVAAVLGLLGAVTGLAHHYFRRRRGPGGRGEVPAVPGPRPPADEPGDETVEEPDDEAAEDGAAVPAPTGGQESVR
jgi:peptidoglycan/xylan/chitin deacetylase (PgdA/CDA1 family)